MDWVREQQLFVEQRKRQLEATAPTITLPVRDSFHTAPGYRELGMEFTCIPDSAYPWDPAVLKQIWSFDPTVVPLWLRWVFLSPSDTGNPQVVVFGRHAIGRALKNPHAELVPLPVEMPSMPCQGVTFSKPTLIEFIWMGKAPEKYVDLPGEYLPFNSMLSSYMRHRYLEISVAEAKRRIIDGQQEAEEKRKHKAREEDAYHRRTLEKYVNKQLEKVSEVEMAEHFGQLRQGKKEPKPFVYVHNSGGLPTS